MTEVFEKVLISGRCEYSFIPPFLSFSPSFGYISHLVQLFILFVLLLVSNKTSSFFILFTFRVSYLFPILCNLFILCCVIYLFPLLLQLAILSMTDLKERLEALAKIVALLRRRQT